MVAIAATTVGFARSQPEPHALVYNRVAKASSSSMTLILMEQATSLHLQVHFAGLYDFPDVQTLNHTLQKLVAGRPSIYIRHAHHLFSAHPALAWINVVREPVERWRSEYDFQRSESFKRATGHGATSEVDPCGRRTSSLLECLNMLEAASTPIRMPSQMEYFCEPYEACHAPRSCTKPNSACSLQQALHTLHTRYHLVGLTERFKDTVALLQMTLPTFFHEATHHADMWVQPDTRPTNRSSAEAGVFANASVHRLLERRSPNYADERRFYESARELFEHKWANSRHR